MLRNRKKSIYEDYLKPVPERMKVCKALSDFSEKPFSLPKKMRKQIRLQKRFKKV